MSDLCRLDDFESFARRCSFACRVMMQRFLKSSVDFLLASHTLRAARFFALFCINSEIFELYHSLSLLVL
jgi:hypothetical protein